MAGFFFFDTLNPMTKAIIYTEHQHHERVQLDKACIRKAINEGLASGEAIPVSESMFDELRAVVMGKSV